MGQWQEFFLVLLKLLKTCSVQFIEKYWSLSMGDSYLHIHFWNRKRLKSKTQIEFSLACNCVPFSLTSLILLAIMTTPATASPVLMFWVGDKRAVKVTELTGWQWYHWLIWQCAGALTVRKTLVGIKTRWWCSVSWIMNAYSYAFTLHMHH